MNKATGIILAGGRSSRMGTDKGLIEFQGKRMVEHCIAHLAALNVPVLIISNNSAYEQFGLPVIPDEISDKGPVGGIATALTFSNSDKNVVLSCDAPFATTELLNHLLNQSGNFDVTIPEFEGKIHPLLGIYHKGALTTFKDHLQRNQLRLREVCKALNTQTIDLTGHPEFGKARYFANFNSEDDIKQWACE